MFIAGIDYSLTCPAVCVYNGADTRPTFRECHYHYLTKTQKYVGRFGPCMGHAYPSYDHPMVRYSTIADWVVDCLRRHRSELWEVPLVGIEDYAFSANGRITDLSEYTGILKHKLYDMGIPYKTISISSVKKALVGVGNADKGKISEVYGKEIPSVFQLGKSPISDCLDAYGVLLAGI